MYTNKSYERESFPKFGVILKDKSNAVYHYLDLHKRIGTYCNLAINEQMKLYIDIPIEYEPCETCKKIFYDEIENLID